jgi:cell division protein FtsB
MAKDDRGRGTSLRRKLVLVAVSFFFLVLLISSLFGKKGLIEIYRAKKSYEALLLEIKELEAQKTRLQREIDDLKSNPQAVEKKAREELGLMKPEEKVIIKKKREIP